MNRYPVQTVFPNDLYLLAKIYYGASRITAYSITYSHPNFNSQLNYRLGSSSVSQSFPGVYNTVEGEWCYVFYGYSGPTITQLQKFGNAQA